MFRRRPDPEHSSPSPSQPPAQKILFLAANPQSTTRLRLDQELRDIEDGLRRSQARDRFALEQRWAVRPRDIQRAMLDENPSIVHFSGHGKGEDGLVFEDHSGQIQLVSGEALAGLFGLFAEQIDCVLLNGCYSAVQAQAIVEQVPYVIGMTKAIGDRAAIAFAVGFYDALGAGRDIEFAYKLGCNAIEMERQNGSPGSSASGTGRDIGSETDEIVNAAGSEHLTPILLRRVVDSLAQQRDQSEK